MTTRTAAKRYARALFDVALAVLMGEFLFDVPLRGSVALLFGMAAVRIGQQTGAEYAHARLAKVTETTFAQPLVRASKPGSKSPVLVHHQTHALADLGCERTGFGEGRAKRLLTHDVDAPTGRLAHHLEGDAG